MENLQSDALHYWTTMGEKGNWRELSQKLARIVQNWAGIERKVGGNVQNRALKYWTGCDGVGFYIIYNIGSTIYKEHNI